MLALGSSLGQSQIGKSISPSASTFGTFAAANTRHCRSPLNLHSLNFRLKSPFKRPDCQSCQRQHNRCWRKTCRHQLVTRAIGSPGVCFDRACAQAQDQIFLLVIAVPIICLTAAVAYALRPAPKDRTFTDPDTGAIFESTDGSEPQRDHKGELAFRAQSYTPWPVEEDFEGERIRINVGPVNAKVPRTFVFPKLLRQPSQIVEVTLQRPLGVIFEEDARRKRVVVSGFVDGSNASQLAQVAKLDKARAARAPQEGDVLRACTCTNFVFPTQSLFGAKPPQRTVVVYGAEQQKWSQVITALKRGDSSDGPVTLILERQLSTDDQ